jgi:hypothetical protein
MTRKMCLLLTLLSVIAISSAVAQEATHSPTKKPRKKVPAMKIEGGVEVTSVKEAQDMALPREQFKGIHFVHSSEFFKKFPERKNTPSGLYLLDTELIPKQLPVILARNHVDLGPDGSLVNQKGQKVVMLLGYKLAAVRKKQGSLPANPGFFDLFGPTHVLAANPFPLEWVSYWYSWVDDEGFCRSLTASTGADAWGPVIDPWGDRVHTNIEQIEAVAGADDAEDDKWCNNCGWEFAQANRDFGCWWPAHGSGVWGWAAFKDGSFNWSQSW